MQSGTVALALNWPEATARLPLKDMLMARESELTHRPPPFADVALKGTMYKYSDSIAVDIDVEGRLLAAALELKEQLLKVLRWDARRYAPPPCLAVQNDACNPVATMVAAAAYTPPPKVA